MTVEIGVSNSVDSAITNDYVGLVLATGQNAATGSSRMTGSGTGGGACILQP